MRCIHEAVLHAATASPSRLAVRCRSTSLTWAELAADARRLARVLCEAGVGRGERVAVLTPKSVESVVAVHGVMISGAAYVPLDPTAPPGRLAHQINDCGARILITVAELCPVVGATGAHGAELDLIIGLDRRDLDSQLASRPALDAVPWGEVRGADAIVGAPNVDGGDLAYVIYTSGSTGLPKGIQHSHRSSLAFSEHCVERYSLRAEDRFTGLAQLHFDMSIFDLFASAVAGAAVVLVPEEHLKFPASLAGLLESERISVVFAVPFVLSQLLLRGALPSCDLSPLRWIIFGGENAPTEHVRVLMRLLPETRFNHMYGPAETNGCTCFDVPPLADEDTELIPIGAPFPTVETLVFDDAGDVVGVGGVGELLVAGESRMIGYLGRPDLDAQVFWRRPDDGTVFYRTGDLVSILRGGGYRFAGRRDRQIKTRGHRVELDEIEAVLRSHDGVQEVAVFTVPERGTHGIEAAVEGDNVSIEQLLEHARCKLPRYAVPRRIQKIEGFPRSSAGKIDYVTLQARATAKPDGD